jgi:hypothetical protein
MGPKGMVEAVKASKKKQAQNEARSKLVKAAERQYKANGGCFYSPDELAETFIRQEEDNFALFSAVGKLSKEVEKVETEVYDLQG